MNFATLFEFFEEAELPEYCTEVDSYLTECDSIQAFYALDRMTHEVDGVSMEDVEEYLSTKDYSALQFQGLMNNWKGIYGEIEVLEALNEHGTEGITYKIPSFTNNPDVDIFGIDERGNVVEKYQVKMSLDTTYLNKSLADLPEDVKLICPSEVAEALRSDQVLDVGVHLESVMEELEAICDVVEQKEPWEKELDNEFYNWLDTSKVS